MDEVTLALLYLVMHDEDEYGAKAWKGFDWDTMNRLHERGFIGNPVGKTKSVVVTPEGCNRAKELFKKHFVKTEQIMTWPASAPQAPSRRRGEGAQLE